MLLARSLPKVIPLWPDGAPGSEGWTQPPEGTRQEEEVITWTDLKVVRNMAASVSVHLYSEWRAAGRPVELHIYLQGGHGFGMRQQGPSSDAWIDRFADWLQVQGLLDPNP